MGYYSEVYILMDKESTDDFIKKLAKELPEHIGFYSNALENGFEVFGIDETKPYRIFHFPWVKWYDDRFPEVKMMMEFLRALKAPHYYDFVRIGEENGDIEQEYSDDFYFNVTVDVSLDEP